MHGNITAECKSGIVGHVGTASTATHAPAAAASKPYRIRKIKVPKTHASAPSSAPWSFKQIHRYR